MNTITNNIVQQKANFEKICEFKNKMNLYCPIEDINGKLYVLSISGEILSFTDSGQIEPFLTVGGQPSSIIYDKKNNLFIGDMANNLVLFKYNDEKQVELEQLVSDYEGVSFKGPSSLAYNIEDNILYIADSGPFGTINLSKPQGSIYLYDLRDLDGYHVMRPLMLNCLSNPSAIIYDNNKGNLYVAETFANRIIRLTQNPVGVYHASVFYQFSGRVGPTCLALDDLDNLYVGRFEFQNNKNEIDGVISVISSDGGLVGEIIIPKMPEITGLYISKKKKDVMYVTENNCNGILRVKIESFKTEVGKLVDYFKIY